MQIDQLFEHQDGLRALAASLVRDPATADDLVQDTWVAALGAERGGAVVDHPSSWLRRILRNFAHLRFRRQVRARAREELRARPETQPEPECGLERLETVRLLAGAVLSLEPDQREVVVMRYLDGLDSKEIALRCGVSPSAVRMRLKRALDRLRAQLDDEYEGDRSAWLAVLAPFAQSGAAVAATTIAIGWLAKVGLVLISAVALGAFMKADGSGPSGAVLEARIEALESELDATQERLAQQSEQIEALIEIVAEANDCAAWYADSA